MATLDTIRPIAAENGLRNTLATLFGVIADWNDRRTTRKSLSGLTNRELEDIGLMRGDIDSIVDGTYRR